MRLIKSKELEILVKHWIWRDFMRFGLFKFLNLDKCECIFEGKGEGIFVGNGWIY